MNDALEKWGPVTVMMMIATTLLIGGGVAVSIINPDTYSFAQLLDDLKTFAIGLGALGVGRGLHAGLRDLGLGINLPGTIVHDEPHDSALPDTPVEIVQ